MLIRSALLGSVTDGGARLNVRARDWLRFTMKESWLKRSDKENTSSFSVKYWMWQWVVLEGRYDRWDREQDNYMGNGRISGS